MLKVKNSNLKTVRRKISTAVVNILGFYLKLMF